MRVSVYMCCMRAEEGVCACAHACVCGGGGGRQIASTAFEGLPWPAAMLLLPQARSYVATATAARGNTGP